MKYYIIAGEASGDLLGSNLLHEIKQMDTEAVFRCWGGDLMRQQGAELVKHYRELAFMGLIEVIIHLGDIVKNLQFCKRDLIAFQPDVLILIDYPDFNIRMARFAHAKGIRVFYYVSPQLWAWRASRVKTVKECVDRMFVVLPFEKDFYKGYEYPVDFVGHPILDVMNKVLNRPEKTDFIQSNHLDNKPIIAILPGSRRMEVKKMLPVMLSLTPLYPDYQFVIGAAPSLDPYIFRSVKAYGNVKIVFDQTYVLLRHSVAALVTSGTATLETALLGVPQVVCYRANVMSYLLARQMVKVHYISLVNLIMDKPLIKELIQYECNGKVLKQELDHILKPEIRTEIQSGYDQLKMKLGGEGASRRAAALMIQYLRGNTV